jgi:hypothetical protein
MDTINYRCKYKFQLFETYCLKTDIIPPQYIENDFISLDCAGYLTIKKGYAWDGATGVLATPKSMMRSTLVHDALYQLIREKKLSHDFKTPSDVLLRDLSHQDGMLKIIAKIVFWAVQKYGNPHTDPAQDRPVVTAP